MFLIFVLIFSFTSTVFASETVLYKGAVSADNNRLFDVPVNIKSDKILTAAAFTVSYDKNALVFRKAFSDINGAKVRFNDSGGSVKVIFLITDGVRINKKAPLLSVRFKSLKSGESTIKIIPSDFVDINAKNFKAPNEAVWTVNVSGKSGADAKGSYGKASGSKDKLSGSLGSDADDDVDNDIAPDDTDKKDDGLLSVFDTTLGDKNSPIVYIIFAGLAVAAAGAAVGFIIRNDKIKKTKKKESLEENDED